MPGFCYHRCLVFAVSSIHGILVTSNYVSSRQCQTQKGPSLTVSNETRPGQCACQDIRWEGFTTRVRSLPLEHVAFWTCQLNSGQCAMRCQKQAAPCPFQALANPALPPSGKSRDITKQLRPNAAIDFFLWQAQRKRFGPGMRRRCRRSPANRAVSWCQCPRRRRRPPSCDCEAHQPKTGRATRETDTGTQIGHCLRDVTRRGHVRCMLFCRPGTAPHWARSLTTSLASVTSLQSSLTTNGSGRRAAGHTTAQGPSFRWRAGRQQSCSRHWQHASTQAFLRQRRGCRLNLGFCVIGA